ncbi:hypothetical protein LCGC14_2057590, partial [marine sediment metagenome]
HRDWHKAHYYNLETLITDFTYHEHPAPTVQLLELRNWAFKQTISPTKTREEPNDT